MNMRSVFAVLCASFIFSVANATNVNWGPTAGGTAGYWYGEGGGYTVVVTSAGTGYGSGIWIAQDSVWLPNGSGSLVVVTSGNTFTVWNAPNGFYILAPVDQGDQTTIVNGYVVAHVTGSSEQQTPTYLPQRRLTWTVTNDNPPPSSADKLQTWAVFQYEGTTPTGIAFASQTLEAGQSATLTVYVAQDDPYSYAPARVDYRLSVDTYGTFPTQGTAFGRNPDGTVNYNDPQYRFLEGVSPLASSTGTTGSYTDATQVTEITPGTSGPGVDNTTPVLQTPTPTTGGTVVVAPGGGGTATSTDTGTASAIEQGANAIITAVNNTGSATRLAIDRNTAAVNAGIAAQTEARQAEGAARAGIAAEAGESGVAAAMAQRDAQLASSDAQAGSLFAGLGVSEMKSEKVTPDIGEGDPSAWILDLGRPGWQIDLNPFTNPWVQEKLPFFNWLVGLFRLSVVWSAQVAFYRWLVNTIRENAIVFMHTPSPPPTVVESIASSNPLTGVLGKVGAAISSVFLAAMILSSLSTILSVTTSWGTISALIESIRDGTHSITAHFTGAAGAALGGHMGRIVYMVKQFFPVTALLGISANYILIETGLFATMPVLVFAMRIRRW